MKKNFLTKMTFLALVFLCLGTGSVWGAEGDVTTNIDVDCSATIADGKITGTKGELVGTAMTNVTDNKSIALGNGSLTATVPTDERCGSGDVVEVKFDLAFGKLSGRNVFFYLKDASGNNIASFTFCPYGGTLTTDLGVETNDLYYGYNTILWDRRVYFTITLDYKSGKIKTVTKCYKSGTGKAATDATHEVTMINTNSLASFVVGSNYNNSGRYCQFANLTVKTTEGAAVTTADYKVKYVCEDTEIKDAVTRNGNVGNAITLTAADKANFFNDGETIKYIYVSDDSEGKTIAGDGTSVVTVTFREAATYNWSAATNVGDLDLGSGTCFEGDNVSVSYPLYVNVDGTLYTKAVTNQTYAASFTPDADNYVYTAEYTATNITNVVYFSEAENITGATATSAGANMVSRSSNQKCAYAESDITLINLPAGVYKATSVQYSNSTAGLTLKYLIGTDSVINVTSGAANWDTKTNEFSLPVAADFKWLTSGSAKNGLDFIYIQKIGEVSDLSYTKDLSATGFASFSAPVNVTVPDGTYAYKAAISGSTVTLTKVEGVIPANTGVILYNSEKPSSVTLAGTTETGADYTGNELIATSIVANRTVKGATDASSYTYYALNANAATFGQITADITLSDNKAYLKVDAAQPTATALTIAFGDDATGIESAIVDADAENNVIYNVYGIRVDENYKGLVIVNGKKYLKK